VPTDARDLDIVLLGATGFTGALIARYLATHAPPTVRIGLAGRNRAKLEAVRDGTGSAHDLVTVDATDATALRDLTARCRVLVTTVGPYIVHGDPVVAACADTGTDYLDLTGEPEFMDLTYLRHHARAEATGARLVHACGFDSVPHDLGAQFTVEHLPEGVPLSLRGLVRMRGTFSGGTAASALEIMGRARQGRATHDIRHQVEPEPEGRTVRVVTRRAGRDPETGWWTVPMPTIDPLVVAESARLLPRYGPEFRYSHNWAGGSPLALAGFLGGVGAVAAAAQVPPLRRALTRLRPSGTGPTEAQRDAAWFAVRFLGEGGGTRVTTEVSGGDPGYTETSKMIGEAALSLALDDLPPTAGQVTTASALGPALRARLEAAGITFRVLDPAP
jgi:saccharopine dehydrogenase (NAD+, L-glutamate forming)